MEAPLATVADEFEEWLRQRPKWLQTAAAAFASTKTLPNGEEIRQLADLCAAEAAGTPGATFESVPAGLFGDSEQEPPLRIRKLDKVVGVNAIRENACLDFGDADMAVVFGFNGSGKSGYARLLKHICGARSRSELLSNVFAETPPTPSCEVSVLSDATEEVLQWASAGGEIKKLRSVHVFDSAAAATYVDSNSEASYEPRRMRFLSALIWIADRVAEELAKRKAQLPKAFPAIPAELIGTMAAAFIANLRHNTADAAVDAACAWSPADAESRHAVEASLKQHDVAGRIKQLELDKKNIALFATSLESLKSGLSEAKASELIAAGQDALAKRKAAVEDAEKVFANAALDGVGHESWRLLWEQARKYSEDLAYPGSSFPVIEDDSRCVLCHQTLDVETRGRLRDFEAFVKGGLEAAAAAAEKRVGDAIQAVPKLPEREKWDLNLEFLKVAPEAGGVVYDAAAARAAAFPAAVDSATLPVVDWAPIDLAVTVASAAVTNELAALTELLREGKKAELEKTLKELRAREWLSQQKAAVHAEITRLESVRLIEKAEALTKTNTLTAKKNDIAKDELAHGYRDRFLEELRMLGGSRLGVEPIPVPQGKGKISFKLAIRGARRAAATGLVLSEGENRIVALAAFLADIRGSGKPMPFVFDDPVSSLDQEFEERVVARLVALAEERQVIVFTHRLSLLAGLEDEIENVKRGAAASGRKVPILQGVSLVRMLNSAGIAAGWNARQQAPKKGFATIRDHRIPKLRKLHLAGDADAFEAETKSVCSDFRILVERSIEKVLIGDVMERFRRSVKTLKIHELAKIDPKDCALIDTMMTKYSKFEHSQSDELPVPLPSPDELLADAEAMLTWIDEFGKRATA